MNVLQFFCSLFVLGNALIAIEYVWTKWVNPFFNSRYTVYCKSAYHSELYCESVFIPFTSHLTQKSARNYAARLAPQPTIILKGKLGTGKIIK